jgi:hypothetical protein
VVPIGATLGHLTRDEARLVCRLVEAMTGDGGALLTFDDAGAPVIVVDLKALAA